MIKDLNRKSSHFDSEDDDKESNKATKTPVNTLRPKKKAKNEPTQKKSILEELNNNPDTKKTKKKSRAEKKAEQREQEQLDLAAQKQKNMSDETLQDAIANTKNELLLEFLEQKVAIDAEGTPKSKIFTAINIVNEAITPLDDISNKEAKNKAKKTNSLIADVLSGTEKWFEDNIITTHKDVDEYCGAVMRKKNRLANLAGYAKGGPEYVQMAHDLVSHTRASIERIIPSQEELESIDKEKFFSQRLVKAIELLQDRLQNNNYDYGLQNGNLQNAQDEIITILEDVNQEEKEYIKQSNGQTARNEMSEKAEYLTSSLSDINKDLEQIAECFVEKVFDVEEEKPEEPTPEDIPSLAVKNEATPKTDQKKSNWDKAPVKKIEAIKQEPETQSPSKLVSEDKKDLSLDTSDGKKILEQIYLVLDELQSIYRNDAELVELIESIRMTEESKIKLDVGKFVENFKKLVDRLYKKDVEADLYLALMQLVDTNPDNEYMQQLGESTREDENKEVHFHWKHFTDTLNNFVDKFEEYERDNKRLGEQLKEAEEEKSKLKKDHKEEIEKLGIKAQEDLLQDRLKRSQQRNTDHDGEISILKTDIKKLKQELAKKPGSLENLKAEANKRGISMLELKALTELQEKSAEHEKTVQAWIKKTHDKEVVIRSKNGAIEDLQEKLKNANEQIESHEEVMRQVKSQASTRVSLIQKDLEDKDAEKTKAIRVQFARDKAQYIKDYLGGLDPLFDDMSNIQKMREDASKELGGMNTSLGNISDAIDKLLATNGYEMKEEELEFEELPAAIDALTSEFDEIDTNDSYKEVTSNLLQILNTLNKVDTLETTIQNTLDNITNDRSRLDKTLRKQWNELNTEAKFLKKYNNIDVEIEDELDEQAMQTKEELIEEEHDFRNSPPPARDGFIDFALTSTERLVNNVARVSD